MINNIAYSRFFLHKHIPKSVGHYFLQFTKPLYFPNRVCLGMIQCTKKKSTLPFAL